MDEKQTQTNRIPIGWPFFRMPEKGMDNMVDGFAVYRNMTKEMTDLARQYLNGNYDEMIKKWQLDFESGSQDIMDLFFRPYRAGSSMMKGTVFGENMLKSWQQLMGMDVPAAGMPAGRMADMRSFYEKWQKDAFQLMNDWSECLMNMVKTLQASPSRWTDSKQAMETWLSACEESHHALIGAHIAFAKERMGACLQMMKSFSSEKADTASERGEDDEPERKKTVKKNRP